MSDIKYKKRLALYALFTVLTLLFGFIYEQFSHEVYSGYMMYAFVFPLLGFIVSFLLRLVIKGISKLSLDLLDISVMTFTFGSVMKGILEIYGTSNGLSDWYFYAGIVLAALFVISMAVRRNQNDQ